MNWLLADAIMFACSIGLYVAVRKAALDKAPTQFNNLAMFAIPFVIFAIADVCTHHHSGVTLSQALQILITGVILSYYGNAMSMKSIELAPNAGYSLIISKSYVVMTTFLAVPLFGARLTATALLSIGLIIAASALIMINPKAAHHAKSAAWLPLAFGSFLCWGFLSLMAKHLISEGVPTIVFLTYVFAIATICILVEMWHKKMHFSVITIHKRAFTLIGVAAAGFNFFNFYTLSIAPNVGYVNATNAGSIGVVTVLSAVLFKDELTRRKLIGVVGVLSGLTMLFVWK